MKRIIILILSISFGVFVFVYGGIDDSPGAQLLGLLLTVGGIVCFFRGRKKF